VSELVITRAKEDHNLEEMLSDVRSDDIKDIELYISLLESIHTQKYSDLAATLRFLFCQIIQENLRQDETHIDPHLTVALLDLHNAISEEEQLAGIISLNYDNLLDRACNEVFRGLNYGIKAYCDEAEYTMNETVPILIKLHGSFNWKEGFRSIIIDERQAQSAEQTEMLWIPPSIQKEKDTYPFNLLWGKAFELLDCAVLRIVGCKLSQNDCGLISLLFNSQLEQGGIYEIELICSHKGGERIRERNGFLKNVKILGELDNCQDLIEPPPENRFESWLRRKIAYHSEKGIMFDQMDLPYLKKITGED
jgi:hypothetical protein